MRLRERFRALLGLDESPERTALAFSLGVFLGYSPFLGLHTVLGISAAFLLRLNRPAVLLGVYSNVIWWMVPFYAFAAWFGWKVLGLPAGQGLPEMALSDLFTAGFWNRLVASWPVLQAAFWGSLTLSTFLALLSFPLSLALIRRYRVRKNSVFDPKDDHDSQDDSYGCDADSLPLGYGTGARK